MEIEKFIELVKESFDELETDINASTEYKKIEEWTSMQALILIAHLDDTTGVILSADDLKNAQTIDQLYKIVTLKLN